MPQVRAAVLSSPVEMTGLIVRCSQEKDLNFSEEYVTEEVESSSDDESLSDVVARQIAEYEDLRLSMLLAVVEQSLNDEPKTCQDRDMRNDEGKSKRQFLVSSETRDATFFHTCDTTMDHLIVSSADEWRLSSIAEWMPACHSDTQAEWPSSHGPMITPDYQSRLHRLETPPRENRRENLRESQRFQASRSYSPVTNTAPGERCRSLNSQDFSPIQDASLERRYKLVDDCLVRTLRVLVERPSSEKDLSLSPKGQSTKPNDPSVLSSKNNIVENLHRISPEGSSARKQMQFDQSVRTRKSVDDRNKSQYQPGSSQNKGKVNVRASKEKRGVSIVVVPSNCRQVLKITPGMVVADNFIKNRCLWRLVSNRHQSIKVKGEVLDVSNRSSETTPSSNSHALNQGSEGDSVSERGVVMPSSSCDSLGVRIEKKTLQDKGKKGLAQKRKSFPSDRPEYTPSGQSSSRTRRMPKVPHLVTGQSDAAENRLVTFPESQGFIPTVGSQVEDSHGEDLISPTQGFIPSLNDDTQDDTQTQSLW